MTDTCTISGTVRTPAGDLKAGAMVRVRILGSSSALRGEDAYSSASVTTYTDEDGSWSVDVPQGAVFRIKIPEADLDATGSAPAALEADLSTIPLTYDKP